MNAKYFLNQYKRLCIRIDQYEDRIKNISEIIDSMAIDYSGMPRGTNTSNPTEAKAIKLLQEKEQLCTARLEAISAKEDITTAIDSVTDSTLSELLYKRYVFFNSWEKIAVDMGYSYRHICGSLHCKALKEIEEIIKHRT